MVGWFYAVPVRNKIYNFYNKRSLHYIERVKYNSTTCYNSTTTNSINQQNEKKKGNAGIHLYPLHHFYYDMTKVLGEKGALTHIGLKSPSQKMGTLVVAYCSIKFHYNKT